MSLLSQPSWYTVLPSALMAQALPSKPTRRKLPIGVSAAAVIW